MTSWEEYAATLPDMVAETPEIREAFEAGRASMEKELEESNEDWTAILERTESAWRKTNRELIAAENECDALRAEVEATREVDDSELKYRDDVLIPGLEDERDALQAQLDSMTTEWAVRWIHWMQPDSQPVTDIGAAEDDVQDLVAEQEGAAIAVTRLVGPWTPVEGEQS